MTTTRGVGDPAGAAPVTAGWLGRAWVCIASVPVLVFAAFALGYLLYDAFGYKPENDDAPAWVDLLVAAPVLAVALAPSVGAVLFGRRCHRAGDRRGLVPLAIGAAVGLAITGLTVVTTVASAIA